MMKKGSPNYIKRSSISIIMPALDEEGNIQGSIDSAVYAARKHFDDYEIIVVNDGSTDNTLEIVNRNIEVNHKIKVISHSESRGFGASYDTGRRNARMKYCVMVHGDNVFDKHTLADVFSHTGMADVVCGFIANPESRNKTRQVISKFYTKLMNFIFHLDLKYFNGIQIHQTEWLKDVSIESSGFGFQAELLIKSIKDDKSYVEVPYMHIERLGGGATKIFKLKNIISIMKTIYQLYFLKDIIE